MAYNRVGLTQYFNHRDANRLLMQPLSWYEENGISLYLNEKAIRVDIIHQYVESIHGKKIYYDYCVLATGSRALVPPNFPGLDAEGVFVYRTINDLDDIIRFSQGMKKAAVIGGGLLGLEAAKATKDLGLDTIIFERNGFLMNRQLDSEGAAILLSEIEKLNIMTQFENPPVRILTNENYRAYGIETQDGTIHDNIDMIIFAIGIKPCDDIARSSGITVHARGGILINDYLETNIPNVFAIGEVAVHNNMVYGLVAPGYEMANILARNLTTHVSYSKSKQMTFLKGDLSSKLKLLGVHVASFGDCFASPKISNALTYRDPFGSIYKKFIFSQDGKKLLGGIMVGDTKDYAKLHALCLSNKPLTMSPSELILGASSNSSSDTSADSLPDEAQICSCNNVSKGTIRQSVRDKKCSSIGQVKACTKAGTGCGGCIPQVTEIVESELKSMGITVKQFLCSDFDHSRVELYQIAKIKKLKTFKDLMTHAGSENAKQNSSLGCEVCKPAIASILASLWNDHILQHTPLQDSNDRFLANIQRDGTFSVVPRVPGGEITPEKLIVLGQIAQDYQLYTKITGGQRIDLFGAKKQDLPDIWERLVKVGFESGHAYGKALRTVKSCVGSNFCRYGIGDSVGFAITIENRYKGIRSPHKLKGGVSGCIRECAEAQGKDFGLIATDKGYNLYVCGNGGSKPKHAVLLVKDASESMAIKYLDRFLMFYISTADKLTRTARWLEKLEGGIDYLRKVVVDDYLGICDELETQMAHLINTYQCEWKTVVENPSLRRKFTQFANTTETQPTIEIITEREQKRPIDWPKHVPVLSPSSFHDHDHTSSLDHENSLKSMNMNGHSNSSKTTMSTYRWVKVGKAKDFSLDSGEVVLISQSQIAVFKTSNNEWFATQNMCPHKRAFVLSQGLLGSDPSTHIPYVACPMHKKRFSLKNGQCAPMADGDDQYKLVTFKVKVDENEDVFVYVPDDETLDKALATHNTMITTQTMGIRKTAGVCGNPSLDW